MHQAKTVLVLLGMCSVFGFGCGSEADVAADETPVMDDSAVEATHVDSLAAEGDIGSVEQAIIMPVVEPGGTGQQCVAACTRFSTTDLTGVCCVCNGAVKKFARGPTASTYLCK